MGIYLGGGDVCVAKHHLYSAQVGAVAEQMSSKRVPDHMGRDVFIDTGGKCRLAHNLPEPQPCHASAASGNKEIITSLALEDKGTGGFEIRIDFFFCLVTEGNEPFFIAFAYDPDETGGKVTGSQGEPDQFGHPEPCRIKQKKHGIVSYTNRRCDVWRRQ